jgi:hypothetical protein
MHGMVAAWSAKSVDNIGKIWSSTSQRAQMKKNDTPHICRGQRSWMCWRIESSTGNSKQPGVWALAVVFNDNEQMTRGVYGTCEIGFMECWRFGWLMEIMLEKRCLCHGCDCSQLEGNCYLHCLDCSFLFGYAFQWQSSAACRIGFQECSVYTWAALCGDMMG